MNKLHIMAVAAAFLLYGGSTQSADFAFGSWRVQVTKDTFEGSTGCTVTLAKPIKGHKATASNRGVSFNGFTHALIGRIKIDDAPPENVLDQFPSGFPSALEQRFVDAGHISVPIDKVINAKQISIRAMGNDETVTFSLAGLKAALSKAEELGCFR